MRKKKGWFRSYEHWLVAVFWVLMAGWGADAIKDSVEAKFPDHIYYWRGFILLLFSLTTWRLYALKNRFFDLQLEEMLPDDNPKKRKILVCFLSETPGNRRAHLDEEGTLIFRNHKLAFDHTMFDAFAKIRAQEPGYYWPWEVLFRMIYHHREVLQKVVLVCSCETIKNAAGFGQMFNQFVSKGHWPERPYVKICVPRRGTYVTVGTDSPIRPEDGFNFSEDFTTMTEGIQTVIARLEDEGYRKSDIAIDFTGGTKVTSIVAAGLTFNNRIQAQYVKVKSGELEVAGYDMVYSNRSADDIA